LFSSVSGAAPAKRTAQRHQGVVETAQGEGRGARDYCFVYPRRHTSNAARQAANARRHFLGDTWQKA
jgi:hypothetical protein